MTPIPQISRAASCAARAGGYSQTAASLPEHPPRWRTGARSTPWTVPSCPNLRRHIAAQQASNGPESSQVRVKCSSRDDVSTAWQPVGSRSAGALCSSAHPQGPGVRAPYSLQLMPAASLRPTPTQARVTTTALAFRTGCQATWNWQERESESGARFLDDNRYSGSTGPDALLSIMLHRFIWRP